MAHAPSGREKITPGYRRFAPNQNIRPDARANCRTSFRIAFRAELPEVGPQIPDLLFVLDAGKHHLGAGNLGARIADVVLERVLAPGDAGILVGLGVIVALDRAR